MPTLSVKWDRRPGEADKNVSTRPIPATEADERARLQSELGLRNAALDAASTQFMIMDVQRARWIIVYANRAIARAHGYDVVELMGRSPTLLVPPKENTEAFERIGSAVREGVSISTVLNARRKDGATAC
jgi:PAS domain S-box-containing protein